VRVGGTEVLTTSQAFLTPHPGPPPQGGREKDNRAPQRSINPPLLLPAPTRGLLPRVRSPPPPHPGPAAIHRRASSWSVAATPSFASDELRGPPSWRPGYRSGRAGHSASGPTTCRPPPAWRAGRAEFLPSSSVEALAAPRRRPSRQRRGEPSPAF